MTCTRCQGLSVKERLDKRGHWWWRCLNCGERVDRHILLNRAEQGAFEYDRAAAMERDLKEWSRWLSRMPQIVGSHSYA